MQKKVGKAKLLQRRFERVHEMMGQLADKAHGIRNQNRTGIRDLQRPGVVVSNVSNSRSLGGMPAPVSALSSVDFPALV
jgi:hypothetical protein